MEWSWLKDWWRLKSLRKRRKLLMQRNNIKYRHAHYGNVDGDKCVDENCTDENCAGHGQNGSGEGVAKVSTCRLQHQNSGSGDEEDDDDVEDMCYCDECIMNVMTISVVDDKVNESLFY